MGTVSIGRNEGSPEKGRQYIQPRAIAITASALAVVMRYRGLSHVQPAVLEALIASRAKLTSRAVWRRSSGFFSRQRRTTRSIAGETAMQSSGGSSFTIALLVSMAELPWNARLPDSIS